MSASLSQLRPWLDERKIQRVLLLTGPSARYADIVCQELDGLSVEHFDGAVVHVPKDAVTAAGDVARSTKPQLLISLGGGAATGLAKALRLELDLPFVAIPTTYSGSEHTNIYGISEGDSKQTGRDERVRPELIVTEPAFTRAMPRDLTIKSLMNALAHPLSALSTGSLGDSERGQALGAITDLVAALRSLVSKPRNERARRRALDGATAAAAVLDAGELGAHHKLVHKLGGALRAEHAALHALLLPHSCAHLLSADPQLAEAIEEATGCADLPGLLFECLKRVAAPSSLGALADRDAARAAVHALDTDALGEAAVTWAQHALLGRNPSRRYQRMQLAPHLDAALFRSGGRPRRVVVALHGRGGSAESIAAELRCITRDSADIAILAPQAPGGAWYDAGYRRALAEDREAVERALDDVDRAIAWAVDQVGAEHTILFGFSQGACLALEWQSQRSLELGGLVALSGARLSAPETPIESTPSGRVLMGISRDDSWIEIEDVLATANALRTAGAELTLLDVAYAPHSIRALERIEARRIITGQPDEAPLRGFGNSHESEALPGALPTRQNLPRRAPYGLYPEQVNGTGFVAPRHQNHRSWLYRIRPSAQRTPFQPLAHPRYQSAFEGPAEPSLCGWRAQPLAADQCDFVDGLVTVGGAGSAAQRRGYAVHLFSATASMEDRAFYNADGDLLLVPQSGRLCVQTEMGLLDVPPGHIAIVPRGLLVSVHLPDGPVRGYAAEVFGRHFELPERGPVGSNALADARHFRAPSAWYEDRLCPGYRITARFGGELFDTSQDHSPYDVVAWHGDYSAYAYDLLDFCPVGNTGFDHPDPSIHTVLSAPMDEQGSHCLDFVFFAPRWDPSENTFRPPFFHRNATTEINGIIADPGLSAHSPFEPGCLFLTPAMTPHGVLAEAVEHALALRDEDANRPDRIGNGSMWFQFESALPMQLTPWARESSERIEGWADQWGSYREHFTPQKRQSPGTED